MTKSRWSGIIRSVLEPFAIHNLFRRDVSNFLNLDPHLSCLHALKYVHRSTLETSVPVATPGIYVVTGGRQVGKSTLLKLIIRRLVTEDQEDPKQVFYLPCDTIESFQQLLAMVEAFEESIDASKPFFLFVDEITFVKEWDRAIKALADRGFFRKGSVTLTGSDSSLLKDAMMRFPGRRGASGETDFHLFPLSFRETVRLYAPELAKMFDEVISEFRGTFKLPLSLPEVLKGGVVEKLYAFWDLFLVTGGFPLSINARAVSESIPRSAYQTYAQWIQGDLIKRGKNLDYARELLHGLIERLGSQVTWHSLAACVPIEHHQTIADYVSLLERMDVVQILGALREDKMHAAPKKARKIHFADPFIFHAVRFWCGGQREPFAEAREFVETKSKVLGHFIEGAVGSLGRRNHETYYLKAEGEVDLVLARRKSFLPIEIKWTPAPRREDLRQLAKYKNGLVAAKTMAVGKIDHMTIVPIPVLAMFL